MIRTKGGKLYECAVLRYDGDICQKSIIDALKEAKTQLVAVETMDDLGTWANHWFGEIE